MKAKEVLKLLKITRQTLYLYTKSGKLKSEKLHNGYYDYDKSSVYALFNKNAPRMNIIYCRVSTQKQKSDLKNQENTLRDFCNKNGVIVDKCYSEIASGMNFDRSEFQMLLKDVIKYQVDKVYITYKDRMSRISFDMFRNLFREFGCDIIPINDFEDNQLTEKEIFSDIISLVHCFAMKMYSKRRMDKLKLIKQELVMEESLDV